MTSQPTPRVKAMPGVLERLDILLTRKAATLLADGEMMFEQTEMGRALPISPGRTSRWRYLPGDCARRRDASQQNRHFDSVADAHSVRAAVGQKALLSPRGFAMLGTLLLAATAADPALAYLGPGLGLGAIGTALGVVGAILLGIVSTVWYPVKRMLRRRKKKVPPAQVSETEQDNTP